MTDTSPSPDPRYPSEPSVLDYVKSLFGGRSIDLPDFAEPASASPASATVLDASPALVFDSTPDVAVQPPVDVAPTPTFLNTVSSTVGFPWRSLLALVLALIAQGLLEPPPDALPLATAFYVAAISMLGWAIYRGEWRLASLGESASENDPLTYRSAALFLSIILALAAFAMLGNNLFTWTNLLLWLSALGAFIFAFWVPVPGQPSLLQRLSGILQGGLTIKVSAWLLLLIGVSALVFFFRFHRTESVPPEPFSDQAEKLFDVYDVSQGVTRIFFPRNTGREAIQMYWTLLVANVFGTGISFFSLKLGTAILGFLTLPFMYLLGKEIGGPRVGLLVLFLAGVAYWPNVISRIGLRFPLYPLFAAPTLLYLIRGLRTRNRNDFLLSGLFLGIGLHGYSPMRIVPFVIAAAFIIYWLHSQSKGARRDLPIWFAMLALVALVAFLPLLRYWVEHPAEFGFRAFSRVGTVEQPLPGPALQIFASNVWKGLQMYNIDDGEIWVNSIPHRPALDTITAALFLFGVILVLVRYLRHRHWLDLFLLISIPLLQLPSTLSLAFPGENPALNRAGGAYIPAFLLAGLALDGLLTSLGRGKIRNALMVGLAGLLLFMVARQNYNLVFDTFYTSFRSGAWNTSDMGRVIREFEQTYGTTETVWVVPYSFWVDTRLPAAWAGIPNRDLAMWPENLPTTADVPGPKLFIVKADVENPAANDQASLDVLQQLYPTGQLRLFDSDVPGHDFWVFTVPN